MSYVWVYLYVLQSWLCVCVHLCLDCPFCINLCLYIVLCLSLHVFITVKLCLCICLWIGMCGMCLRFCKLARHPSEKKRQTTLVSDQVIMLTKWGGKANSICCAALWWGMKHRNIKMRNCRLHRHKQTYTATTRCETCIQHWDNKHTQCVYTTA